MARLRYNNAVGQIGTALASGDTTINFGATAPPFATLVAPDYIPLVLEPPSSLPSAKFEVVYLTAYTAGQTTGTITRGQESTAAVSHASGVTWLCGPLLPDFANVAVLKPLPSHSFTATSAVFASIGHTVNVTTQSGLVLLYYVTSFAVSGAGIGGLAAAIFVDGTKIVGAENSTVTDAKLVMSGSTNPIYFYTDGSEGAIQLPAPFAAGSSMTRTAGQRGIGVATGMASSADGSGQVNPGSPIMLSLTPGERAIDIRYAPTAPNPPTVSVSGGGFMVAVGF